MLSCTCIIILQASLNYMPHHVLLFNILSGTTLLLRMLNNERQHSFVWLHSMLFLNLVSSHRSPLPSSELYPLQGFQRRALTVILTLNVRVRAWSFIFSVSQIFPHNSGRNLEIKIIMKEKNEKKRKFGRHYRDSEVLFWVIFFLTLSKWQASNQGEKWSVGKTIYLQMVFLRYLILCLPKRMKMLKNKWRKTDCD